MERNYQAIISQLTEKAEYPDEVENGGADIRAFCLRNCRYPEKPGKDSRT